MKTITIREDDLKALIAYARDSIGESIDYAETHWREYTKNDTWKLHRERARIERAAKIIGW